jgi:hypothetical protein
MTQHGPLTCLRCSLPIVPRESAVRANVATRNGNWVRYNHQSPDECRQAKVMDERKADDGQQQPVTAEES